MEVTMFRCDRCGDVYEDASDLTTVINSGEVEEWCDDCVSNHASECDVCGEIVSDDELVRVWSSGSYVYACASCAEDAPECECCGDLYVDDRGGETIELYTGEEVNLCSECIREHYVMCDGCGDYVHEDDYYYDEASGRYYCPNCSETADLRGYGHTSAHRFFKCDGDPTPDLMIGVELETEDTRECEPCYLAKEIRDAAEDVTGYRDSVECKSDSSLDDGCEVASQPGTPTWHISSGLWARISDVSVARGATSHNNGNCGLHIHISRNYLSTHDALCTLDRMIQTHPAEWTRFSRRSASSLSHWCAIDDNEALGISADDTAETKREKWGKHYKGRYSAVNLMNFSTVELRLWRGTLKVSTIYATIEATAGLAIIAKELGSAGGYVESLSWSDLKDEIVAALETHDIPSSHFINYCIDRGI